MEKVLYLVVPWDSGEAVGLVGTKGMISVEALAGSKDTSKDGSRGISTVA